MYKLYTEQVKGESLNGYLKLTQEGLEHYGKSYRQLSVSVAPHSHSILRMTITDSSNSRWRIPRSILPNIYPSNSPHETPFASHGNSGSVSDTGHNVTSGSQRDSTTDVKARGDVNKHEKHASREGGEDLQQMQHSKDGSALEYSVQEEPFRVTVCRSRSRTGASMPTASQARQQQGMHAQNEIQEGTCEGGEVLFDMRSLAFKDRYLELSTATPKASKLLGLGEQSRTTGLFLPRDGHVITLWNVDYGAMNIDKNLYGSHPLLLQVAADGTAHGVFIATSNGLEATLNPEDTTFRMVGGMLDVFFLAGPTLEEVVQQYQHLVGRPAMPPAWSLGFHQSRWGYRSVEELASVVQGYAAANIPLDTIWSDIDHMDGFRDFTLDKLQYSAPKMQEFLGQLHRAGRHWVPIVDPGIMIDPGYPAYDAGLKADVFLKGMDQKPYVGQVWPGAVHFPDFLNPRTLPYWQEQLQAFHELAQWSGLWIDMNEPSNFCSGDVCEAQPTSKASTHCELTCYYHRSENRFWEPPYSPRNVYGKLGTRTVATSALGYQHNHQWDTHNLYGIAEGIVTARAVASITGQRPFVLSRSTFSSSGAHTAHWTGDNAASWKDLQVSISTSLLFNALGAPFVGADICGFMGSTWPELCARWISAGSFYTFSRNHNEYSGTPQELYRWPEVASAARNALSLRYQLLPYLYSQFARVHACGGTVMRPIWWSMPEDSVAGSPWACIDSMHEDRSRSRTGSWETGGGHREHDTDRDSSDVNDAAITASQPFSVNLNTSDFDWDLVFENEDGTPHHETFDSSSSSSRSEESDEYSESDSEGANEDQWLWGANVMITPILSPGKFARNVKIPAGFSWLCWQGCPQGVTLVSATHLENSVLNTDTLENQPSVSRRKERLRVVENGVEDLSGWQEPLKQGKQVKVGQIGVGGSDVHVDGVEIDMVPVWLRFGSIVPTSSLFSTGRLASTSRRFQNPNIDHTDKEMQQQQQGAGVSDSSSSSSSRNSSTAERGEWKGEQGFQFQVPTAEETLKAPVDLLVMLGKASVEQDGQEPIVATGFFYQDNGSSQQVDGMRSEMSGTFSSDGYGAVKNSVASQGT